MGKSSQKLKASEKLKNLKTLIHRVSLLPVWYKIEQINHADFSEIHTDIYRKIQIIMEELSKNAVEANKRRNKTERDLDNIELRIQKFKDYVLGDFDLNPTLELQEMNSDFEFNKYVSLLYRTFDRFNNFFAQRNNLQKILRIKEEKLKYKSSPIYEVGELNINESGYFYFQVDELTENLDGLNCDRIRECEICKKVIFADRKDTKCCSLSCRRIYNTRKSRQNRPNKADRAIQELKSERKKINK